MRDLFVGTFSSVAVMLVAYKGYTCLESWLLNFAAVGLMIVASCPMEWAQPAVVSEDVAQSLGINQERIEFVAGSEIPSGGKSKAQELQTAINRSKEGAQNLAFEINESQKGAPANQDHLPHTITGWLHYFGAFLFFICIAIVCWFCADDTLPLIDDKVREKRYRRLYRVTSILMTLVPFFATVLYLRGFRSTVFWVELAGVAVFILYWSIKSYEMSSIQVPTDGPETPPIEGA
jgi:hypothetical protein